jgi:hypothetical protein
MLFGTLFRTLFRTFFSMLSRTLFSVCHWFNPQRRRLPYRYRAIPYTASGAVHKSILGALSPPRKTLLPVGGRAGAGYRSNTEPAGRRRYKHISARIASPFPRCGPGPTSDQTSTTLPSFGRQTHSSRVFSRLRR